MPTTNKRRSSRAVLFLNDTAIFSLHELTICVAYHYKVGVILHIEGGL
jgi:hypothetical protein